MTCNLKAKFKEAETAIREAFDVALKHQDDFNNSETVTDVWMMYSNWRRLDLPNVFLEHSHDDTVTNVPTDTPFNFNVDLPQMPDGSYDPDSNITLDTGVDNTVTFAPPNGDWGEYMSTGDMITFTNANSEGTIGVPAQPEVTKFRTPEQNAADQQHADDINDKDGV
jgi:hypothetical protein|tara:strand:- start:436 stop:936 length:501 start_codon:yes stop_codon:yes gene_type:complete